MNRSRNVLGLLSLIAAVALLALTWGLDALMEYIRHRFAQTFDLALASAGIWIQTLSTFLLAALLLLLFWFVLTRAARNVWVAMLYIPIGLFFGFFRLLYSWPATAAGLPAPPIAVYGLLEAGSNTVLAGSFIAVIGLFMLILRRRAI